MFYKIGSKNSLNLDDKCKFFKFGALIVLLDLLCYLIKNFLHHIMNIFLLKFGVLMVLLDLLCYLIKNFLKSDHENIAVTDYRQILISFINIIFKCFLRCSFIRYINDDTSIVPMMKMLRDSGRSTFLVTNRYKCFS